MTIIMIFLILIFLLLVAAMVGAYLAWQKVSIFLTYNTRYESVEYERAIALPKNRKPAGPPINTQAKGRAIVDTSELVELMDADPDNVMEAIEELGI